ncbi:MAG TPA: SDR family NAD(P)-dependent oxidoreductase, partial [Terriglobales bacterium]|nr:SDR family NAD(P)-dependent oxidoreductase [Terriglobales bacterium]
MSTTPKQSVALVTGAGSPEGIGFATALLLGQRGSKLAITSTTSRIEERAAELRESGLEVITHTGDLTAPATAQEVADKVIRHYGRIDILVNNAGMVQVGSSEIVARFADLTEEQWDHDIAINLKTAFNVTKAVLPHMLDAGYGRIVNVSSVTGPIASNPGMSAYSAAKAGMVGWTRTLALEVAPHGVTVNAVGPGWIQTASSSEKEIAAGKNTPARRPGTPREVAAAIAFLASEEASYVTG